MSSDNHEIPFSSEFGQNYLKVNHKLNDETGFEFYIQFEVS